MRFAHHEVVRAVRAYGHHRLAVLQRGAPTDGDLKAAVEGCVMGSWERRSRQTGPRPVRVDELLLAGFGTGREQEVSSALEVGDAVNQAREWQNMPPNELTPEALAQEARRIADRHGLELEVLGQAELRAGGYNLLLGVAAGSNLPPRMIRLAYKAGTGSDTRLALVGKGITFDSGGISIKPADGMYKMKGDMAGAAAVLAAMDGIAGRRPEIDAMAGGAAPENMARGHAPRPRGAGPRGPGET